MSINPENCRVALLCGGTSGEREISLASGEGAKSALEEAGFPVTTIDPAKKEDLKRLIDEPFDVAFMCMHGKMGEDGTLQGFLEILSIPYTCSHVQASAIAMDKVKSKIMYATRGVPTPASLTLKKGEPYDVDDLVSKLGLPCVIKPATEGSALGVEILDQAEELKAAIERTMEIDECVIAEQFIEGTEITVAVLGNDDPYALPIIKIEPTGDFYDFNSKYAPGGSRHICPAPLPEDLKERIWKYAIEAHKALGCSGVSRSDFIIDKDSNPWILETNTIPGMTATSLLPDAAKASGMSFPELCVKLIEFALEDK